MAKDIYKRKDVVDHTIPNKQIQIMFESICDDEQMQEFTRLIDKGLPHTATAYASQRVMRTFQYWRDNFIKQGSDLDYLQFSLWKRGKRA